MEWIIVIIYFAAFSYIFLFSLGQLHLTWKYIRSRKKEKVPPKKITEWPLVTIQLPVYNEKYVAERLIETIARIDYPADKLEIQVLDDSDDETTDILRKAIDSLDASLDISLVRRDNRKGFKAGALAYGLTLAKGEYIAIFDADFMPEKDFLKRTIPEFDDNTGVVQTRWGHVNKEYSLLTKLQAFALDAHFTVEQTGRSFSNSFINFNGTGGVWRKKCIIDAGGWSDDTLTEDLDLSYRAQLKGWKFRYLEDCVAPAELPVIMPSIKSQQYRWNKGAAESARKNLLNVFKSDIGWINKIHALFHLLNSVVFMALFLAASLSVPLLMIKKSQPALNTFFYLGGIFLIGFFSIAFHYWVATRKIEGATFKKYFFKIFPLFLIVSMGLSLHNGLAVLEGLIGFKTPFIRTPKFNIVGKKDSWKDNTYVSLTLAPLTLFEGLLSLYFVGGIVLGIVTGDWSMVPFHLMMALGFGAVFYYSVRPRYA
ncbi:MAG: glycosyltransferase [Cyclobacteriaceae bacterium]|nr:glycosyltransferase [Cyclobacteriaceae bacterium]